MPSCATRPEPAGDNRAGYSTRGKRHTPPPQRQARFTGSRFKKHQAGICCAGMTAWMKLAVAHRDGHNCAWKPCFRLRSPHVTAALPATPAQAGSNRYSSALWRAWEGALAPAGSGIAAEALDWVASILASMAYASTGSRQGRRVGTAIDTLTAVRILELADR